MRGLPSRYLSQSSMSANQRKNKNKKKNKTKEANDCHSTGSAIIYHVDQPKASVVSSLQCEVLFQGRKGSTTNSNKVYLCTGDMRSLGLQPGAFVHVRVNPPSATHADVPDSIVADNIIGTSNGRTQSTTCANTSPGIAVNTQVRSGSDSGSQIIIGQAWPSAELMRGAVSLTRFWQPSFPDDSRREVLVSRTRQLFSVHQCTAATFALHSSHPSFSYEEVVTSSAFRRYVAAALCETVLCIQNTVVLSWRGEQFSIKVSTDLLPCQQHAIYTRSPHDWLHYIFLIN